MKKHISILKFVLILPLVVTLSCKTTTKIVSSWTPAETTNSDVKKILVLGLMPNREQRDKLEDSMATELNTTGISATTATSVFGPNGFRGLTEDEIVKKLQGSEYTSIMLISLLDREREKNYYPGSQYVTPRVVGYNRFYRRYIVVNDYVYTPGYYTTSTNYILEAEIYSIDTDELLYSAQTNTYDPANYEDLAVSFSNAIVTELKNKRIIR